MDKLTLNAPAKINIGLNIISKRNDGFHNLKTFFYPVYDLHDKLIFEKSLNFIFDTNDRNLLREPDNLVTKAHTLIEQFVNYKIPIKITLNKYIPIGAGLGGGSSDAASTLVGLNEMFKLNISENSLMSLALVLGSDVPFFIKSKPAIGSSRGEELQVSNCYADKLLAIVNPGIHISTKEAFSNINPKINNFNYDYFLQNEKMDLEYLKNNLINDFENYVFKTYPEIQEIKELFYKYGALFSMMSGTGSTVYAFFDDEEKANISLDNLPKNYFKFISNV